MVKTVASSPSRRDEKKVLSKTSKINQYKTTKLHKFHQEMSKSIFQKAFPSVYLSVFWKKKALLAVQGVEIKIKSPSLAARILQSCIFSLRPRFFAFSSPSSNFFTYFSNISFLNWNNPSHPLAPKFIRLQFEKLCCFSHSAFSS